MVQVHLGKFIPSLFIRKIVQMNSDQTINQSAIRSTMVQVLIDQNYNFMKTHSKKMPFCLYELGPFSSSFMLWPVLPFDMIRVMILLKITNFFSGTKVCFNSIVVQSSGLVALPILENLVLMDTQLKLD